MARWNDAAWRGPTSNRTPGGMGSPVYGVVVHIAEGGFEGTISWQLNPAAQVSSFFINSKAGQRAQMVDTVDRAWTQAAGNSHWRGIEHEGRSGEALTPRQVESLAQEIAWLAQLDGWPIRLCAKDPRTVTSQAEGGVTFHAAGGAEWGGHPDCPGQPIITQLPAVVARAQQIAAGGPTMSQPYTAANADAHGWALTQRLKEYQVHAAGADPALTPVPNRVAPLLDKLEAFLDHPPVPLATLSAEDRAAIVVGLTEALKPLIPSAADIAKELGTRLGNG